jgi:adenylate cyclase
MAKEIERKFLVDLTKLDTKKYTNWTVNIEQGYLSENIERSIRIRIEDKRAYITIKGNTDKITRDEYEYEIPFDDAIKLLKMCDKTIIKKRTTIKFNQRYWVVDIFEGDNEGLIVAEIELKNEKEKFALPPWVTEEVSRDSKYYNLQLLRNPYKNW